jgi:hypothetical protein
MFTNNEAAPAKYVPDLGTPLVFAEIADRLANDLHSQLFFCLSGDQIEGYIRTFRFDAQGGSISPMFESIGFSKIDPDLEACPHVKKSNLGTSRSALEHETKHGLHSLVCTEIIENPATAAAALELMKAEVMGDSDFTQSVEKSGRVYQRAVLARVRDFIAHMAQTEWDDDVATQVAEFSPFLGALLYQHAYFVDPVLCESVASFGDTGTAWAIEKYNHLVGKYLIPGSDLYEGYLNPENQDFFATADQYHKALLISRSKYRQLNRNGYFAPQPLAIEEDQPDYNQPEEPDARLA